MRLDFHKTLAEIEPTAEGFRDAMIDISRQSTDRKAEWEWASRLRLLTPALSAMEHEDFQAPLEEDSPDDGKSTAANDEETCSCSYRYGRSFRGDDHRLELLPSDALHECVHYAAVSYCWHSSEQAQYDGEAYQICSNSATRAAKCPPALLERVIRYCSWRDFEYIWIDQECIEQENIEDKQVGVRAMDLVYQRAEASVAVLEVCLTGQRHVDALELMLYSAGEEDLNARTLVDLIEVLEIVMSDPWFSRAWTLQEATSASRHMSLLVRYAEGLIISDYFAKSGNVVLDLAEMNNLVSSWLPSQLELPLGIDASTIARAERIAERWFRSNVANVESEIDPETKVIGSAAEAMWFMEKRENSVISDRLAIMANLCGYDIRLQAVTVEKAGHNFSVAALTLAILNGDTSLLADHYLPSNQRLRSSKLSPMQQRTSAHGFSWCPPGAAWLASEDVVDKFIDVVRIDVLSLSDLGLQVKGCVWTVDLELDFSDITTPLRNNFDEAAIQQALSPEFDEATVQRALSPDVGVGYYRFPPESILMRRVWVAAWTELLCRLWEQGFQPLVQKLWKTYRQRVTDKELRENVSTRAYDEAPFETVIEVSSRRHVWTTPLPPLTGVADRDDPYRTLQDGFSTAILVRIVREGKIVVARPCCSQGKPEHYRGLFDGAVLGDRIFSPRVNFKNESPDRGHGGYPLNWRVRPIDCAANASGDTMYCHGLVAGDWTAEEECMSEIYLV